MPAAKSKSKTPAKLHSFTKQIVTAGEHFVNGERRTITEDQMRRWIANHESMQAKGYRLPAPFKHRKDAVPMTATTKAKGGDGFSLGDSSQNAGFWKKLWVDDATDPVTEEKIIDPDTGKPVRALYGDIHSPGNPEDTNTPAGKIGQTVEECSVYAMSNFRDGKGRKYDDALLHVAVVVNPVELGQPNFVPMGEVDDDALILSMSTAVPFKKKGAAADADEDGEEDAEDDNDGQDDDGDGFDDESELPAPDPEEPVNDLEPLIQMLGQHQGPIHLPQDTTKENFFNRIWVLVNHSSKVAANSKDQGDPNAGTINQPPAGTQPKNRNPYAMSIIKDPNVKKTFEKADAKRREAAKVRVKTLGTDGILDDSTVKEMETEIDAFAMSVSTSETDGYVLDPLPIERTLDILERTSGRAQEDEFGMSHGGKGHVKPLPRPDERKVDKKLEGDALKDAVRHFTSTVRR